MALTKQAHIAWVDDAFAEAWRAKNHAEIYSSQNVKKDVLERLRKGAEDLLITLNTKKSGPDTTRDTDAEKAT